MARPGPRNADGTSRRCGASSTRGWIASFARVAATAILLGCGGPGEARDDAGSDAAAGADAGTPASVLLRARVDSTQLSGGVTLERLTMGAITVRVPNDRGDLLGGVGRSFELMTEPVDVLLEGAEPAVYGSAEIDLGSGSWGPALELRLADGATTIEIRVDEPLALSARCTAPIVLAPGGQLVLTMNLLVDEIDDALHVEPLPAPIDGVVVVDRATAPRTIDALIIEMEEATRLACEATDAH